MADVLIATVPTNTKPGSVAQVSVAPANTLTIAVDPGHGDHNNKNSQVDPGAVNGKDYEKDIVLNISNAVIEALKSKGYGVVQTRTGDVEAAGTKLQWRIDQMSGTNVMVSVHVNSNESARANGFSVCYKLGDATGKKLAQAISSSNTKFSNKGLSARSDLYVLNKFKGTAVLVEAGFISNAQDLSVMKGSSLEIGKEIAAGIISYMENK